MNLELETEVGRIASWEANMSEWSNNVYLMIRSPQDQFYENVNWNILIVTFVRLQIHNIHKVHSFQKVA